MVHRAGSGASHRSHWTDIAAPLHPDSCAPAAAHIRLVIASPVRLVREGLRASLHDRDGVYVVDAVSLDAQGIARIAAAEPDVILVDLGQTDAVTAARLMRGACPDTKLVAFALDEIDTGVFACAAAMFRRLADFLREARPQASLPPLTVRESEILALAEEGRSNKEIARDLTISCATVKNHMHNILQKLQVSRRGQAVARLRSCRGF